MRCDYCKFWTHDVDGSQPEDRQLLGVRKCRKALELWEATEWDEDFSRSIKKDLGDQMSFVMDASSYAASLYTKPEFFCAHFEKVQR